MVSTSICRAPKSCVAWHRGDERFMDETAEKKKTVRMIKETSEEKKNDIEVIASFWAACVHDTVRYFRRREANHI